MPYWNLYYHAVWCTYQRAELIIPEIEDEVHKLIVGAARRHNINVLAIGGMMEHVHVVVSIPPSLSLSDAMSRIKGASSHVIRARFNDRLGIEFRWQSEYGITSLSQSHLDSVCAYVRNQRERHEQRRIVSGLEQTDAGRQPGAEPPG